jgi:adenylate cyclase
MSLLVALSFLGRGWWAALRGSLAWAVVSGAYLGVACLSYGQSRVWLDLAAPQTGALLALAGSLAAGYLVEGRQALRFRRALSRFLSPQVLSAVSGDLDSLRPGVGRRREVSMMFCDVRGFTTLSESMEPEAVMEVLDLYLGRMTEVIMSNGGTLSKYLGDGIMAFWGAPLETPDHAAQAARAAIEMIGAQEEVKLQLVAAGRPAFDIGIGVHTGPAIVGTVGSEDRIEYTALGDTVNVASRVESLTKDFKVRIVVTAETARQAGTGFSFRPLGSVQVKGRSGGVEVLELTGLNKAKTEGSAS